MDEELMAQERELYSRRFWALVGIDTVAMERGRVVNRVRLREEHFNQNEVVHGGVISTLIDSAAGGAVRSMRTADAIATRPHATSDLHVAFISPARGTQLTATARVLKAGRTAVFVAVDVTDDREQLVAHGNATFIVRAPHESSGQRALTDG
ncbi:MAG: PaaI family thioesterase [Tepidiformaceae bacterium]